MDMIMNLGSRVTVRTCFTGSLKETKARLELVFYRSLLIRTIFVTNIDLDTTKTGIIWLFLKSRYGCILGALSVT